MKKKVHRLEILPKPAYRDLSEIECHNLAKALVLGTVFTDMHVPEGVPGEMVFLPLLFLTEKMIKTLEQDPPGMMFEYMKFAAQKRVTHGVGDGEDVIQLPVFQSVNFLTVECANSVKKLWEGKIGDFHKAVKG